MSRIGKKPIEIPKNVKVNIDGNSIIVEGPKGKLEKNYDSNLIEINVADGKVTVTRKNETKKARELHGLIRVLINNMLVGVDKGYSRRLEIVGVGYRATQEGKNVKLQLGFSHPVVITPPEGLTYTVEGTNAIIVSGIDKEAVGQAAVKIREIRPPEPYKGKGIRLSDEKIVIKPGKTGKG
ncbi:MAG TPA: 50S ribosomal protein L6 [bacterium]|nr:50S ribosomal protein L6 [bacterium]HPP86855.1 50S ribosomal protein L6 [bacterium]